MKTVFRLLITSIYTVCWCGLFPVMLAVKLIIALCVWSWADESHSFRETLKDTMSNKWWDSPNELWG